MKTVARFALAVLLSFTASLSAQKLNCDTSCGGGSLGSVTMIQAMSSVTASRGIGPKYAPGRPVSKTIAIPGSNSFTYSVPMFALPGRGLGLNLTLYYNSFIWTAVPGLNGGGGSITLNADLDTPSYGFRLDFGFLELSSDGSAGVLTEANGVKHPLAEVSIPTPPGGAYVSTDGTYIQIQLPASGTSPVIATYKNGTKVYYAVLPNVTQLEYRPYQIEDTNGNIVAINCQ